MSSFGVPKHYLQLCIELQIFPTLKHLRKVLYGMHNRIIESYLLQPKNLLTVSKPKQIQVTNLQDGKKSIESYLLQPKPLSTLLLKTKCKFLQKRTANEIIAFYIKVDNIIIHCTYLSHHIHPHNTSKRILIQMTPIKKEEKKTQNNSWIQILRSRTSG